MEFKYHNSYHIPYNSQGLIYFTCQNIKNEPEQRKQYIYNLCCSVGGEHWKALYEAVTTGDSMRRTATMHNIDISTLYRLVQTFYRSFKFDEVC